MDIPAKADLTLYDLLDHVKAFEIRDPKAVCLPPEALQHLAAVMRGSLVFGAMENPQAFAAMQKACISLTELAYHQLAERREATCLPFLLADLHRELICRRHRA